MASRSQDAMFHCMTFANVRVENAVFDGDDNSLRRMCRPPAKRFLDVGMRKEPCFRDQDGTAPGLPEGLYFVDVMAAPQTCHF